MKKKKVEKTPRSRLPMIHHNIHHTQAFLERKEMNHFYLTIAMVAFGTGLISVFVPIYLYQLGIQIYMIVLYFGFVSLYYLLFVYTAAKIVAWVGAKHAILYAMPCLILYYLLLSELESVGLLFFILPAFLAAGLSLYNLGYHVNFMHHSNRTAVGKTISLVYIFAMVAGALAPLFGALLASVNFSLLFFVGAGILLLSAFPILMTPDTHEKISFDMRSVFRRMRAPQGRGTLYSYIGYAIESFIGRNIWPIFLITVLVSITKTGFIVGLSTLLAVIIFAFIGTLTDRWSKVKLLRIGTVLYVLAWFGRIFASSPFEVMVIDSYKNMSEKVVGIPWWTFSFEEANRENYFRYIVMREVVFNVSRLLIVPLIALTFYVAAAPFLIVFFIAMLCSVGYFFVKHSPNETKIVS